MVLLAAGGVIQGCAGKVSGNDPGDGDAPGSGIPAGCEAALQKRPTGEATCNSNPQQCAQVRQDQATEYQFTFFFMDVQDAENLDCLARFLRGRGGQAEVSQWNSVIATGTFETISPAFGLSMGEFYSVTCAGSCQHCSTLPPDQCDQDAFCAVIAGQRFDPAGCLEPARPVGCYAVSSGCGAAVTAGSGPDGDCWVFPSTCQPSGWARAGDLSYCPGSDYDTPACR